ncbi:DUF5658 family protein [Peribacillus kribbensis]|uniref:DUF5658 family protein n=1 Tax=Peribacillus kribbensis TaxID=356658 RepID=UPI00047EA583
MLLILAVLNFIDAICTYIGITIFHIEEGNPLMGFFLSIHPLVFLSLKISLSALLVYLHLQTHRIHSLFPISALFSRTILPYDCLSSWVLDCGTDIVYFNRNGKISDLPLQ